MSHNPRDHAQHPHRAPEGAATDSHQVPWAGRELSASGFEHDAGAADPALVVALADPGRDVVAEQRLVEAVAGGRLIIPIVAEPAEVDASGELVVETRVEMAAVTLVAPDGQRALPVFSGVGALAAWDPAARPVPVTPARAAQAALDEGCDVLVIDVAGPATRVLRGSMIWALAQERAWLPADSDPVVAAAVQRATESEAGLAAYRLGVGPEGALSLDLSIPAGREHAELTALAGRMGERLAGDPEVRIRLDGLAVRFTAV